jgi:myo-inositol-1(or 4)-monophosphatase
VKKIILEEFPTHKFLGEEDVAPGRDASIEAIKSYVNEVFFIFQNLVVPTLLTNSFTYLRTKDNLWIVDPIDGTTNFAHGIPLCGIIIAYASKGELLYGCIYDPFRFLFTYLLINSPIY